MRKIPLLFSLIVALVLCACTNSKQPVSSSGSNDLGQEVLDVPQTPSIEITFEDMHVYQNALGDTCATYLARLENTSDTAVAITDTSIDIEKPDGTLLTSTDFFSVYPRVVQVGESAYICSDVINGLDESITADQIGAALLHYNVESRPDTTPLSVEITELSLGTQYGYPKFLGRIENVGTSDLSNIYVVAPICDPDGTLQAVGFTIIDSLASGEKKGFEQTCMSASPEPDYSASTITAFAYDGSLD